MTVASVNTKARFPLARSSRILKRAQFLALQQRARKFNSRDLLLFLNPNSLGNTRIGITVSKRVDKRAVVRNKIRRRIREVIRYLLPIIHPPCDIVIVARGSAPEVSFEDLRQQLHTLLGQRGYLRDQ
jgi:ribonuclease P protein component